MASLIIVPELLEDFELNTRKVTLDKVKEFFPDPDKFRQSFNKFEFVDHLSDRVESHFSSKRTNFDELEISKEEYIKFLKDNIDDGEIIVQELFNTCPSIKIFRAKKVLETNEMVYNRLINEIKHAIKEVKHKKKRHEQYLKLKEEFGE